MGLRPQPEECLFDHQLENLAPDQLVECCKVQRGLIDDIFREVDELRGQLDKSQRVSSFPESLSSLRADIDSPDDTSPFLCFGERPKFSTVIAFRPGHSLEVRDRVDLVREQSEIGINVMVA
jgi:hypothetical protein